MFVMFMNAVAFSELTMETLLRIQMATHKISK